MLKLFILPSQWSSKWSVRRKYRSVLIYKMEPTKVVLRICSYPFRFERSLKRKDRGCDSHIDTNVCSRDMYLGQVREFVVASVFLVSIANRKTIASDHINVCVVVSNSFIYSFHTKYLDHLVMSLENITCENGVHPRPYRLSFQYRW